MTCHFTRKEKEKTCFINDENYFMNLLWIKVHSPSTFTTLAQYTFFIKNHFLWARNSFFFKDFQLQSSLLMELKETFIYFSSKMAGTSELTLSLPGVL